MFGLEFLNNLFLAGMAAAALPVLIHLFSKKKAREIPFSSLEYLKEISLKRVRRMQLRQFLLLALRVLIVALFALAMTRPAIQGTGMPMTRGSSTVAIVVDNSFSMSAADPSLAEDLETARDAGVGQLGSGGEVSEDGTLYQMAKQRAIEILDLMREGDQGVLAFSGRPVALPFQTPVANLGLLRQEISRMPFSADRSELPAAVEQALEILNKSRTLNKELFVVSDFQRQDLERWATADPSGNEPGLASLLAGADADSLGLGDADLGEGVRVYLVPVRGEEQANLSIERLRFDPGAGIAGAGRVRATVRNHGADPVENRVLQVRSADDAKTPLGDALLSVPALGEADLDVDLPDLPENGAVEVALGSDLLEWDNRAYLVTSDPGVKQVLIVSGSKGARASDEPAVSEATGLSRDDSDYIRRALDPRGDKSFFEVRLAGVEALTEPAGPRADLIILSDVGRLPEAAVENLGRFRSRGGGILVALGDRVDLRYYNTYILGRLAPAIEFMNILQEDEGAYRSIRPSVVGHPIFRGFTLSAGDDLSSARFRKIVDCKVGEGARVIAEFGGQLPALVEQEGVVVFTSSFDGSWNDFVTSASFLPTLHQVLHHLSSRGGRERGPRRVGSELEALVDSESFQEPVTLVDPIGGRTPVDAVPFEGMVRLRSETTSMPGVHSFVDATGQPLSLFAVNLDPGEGNLTVASNELRSRLFGRDAQQLVVSQPVTREVLEGRYGRELWRPILMLVLVLLVVESLLGRGRFLA